MLKICKGRMPQGLNRKEMHSPDKGANKKAMSLLIHLKNKEEKGQKRRCKY